MKAAKKVQVWVSGSAMVMLAAGIVGCGKDKTSTPSAAMAQEATFSVSPTEKAFMQHIAEEDFNSWAQTGTMVKTTVNPADAPKTLRVDANTIQNEYSANEVSADLKYRDKYMLVTGVVSSIDRSVGANYFLRLKNESNRFNDLHAKMANDNATVNYLAGLKKGQKVLLYGKCDGMLMKSVTLTECVPSGTWATAYTEKYIEKYLEVLPAWIKAKSEPGVRLGLIATKLSSLFVTQNPLIKQPIVNEKVNDYEDVAFIVIGVLEAPEEQAKKGFQNFKVSNRAELLKASLHDLEKNPGWKEAIAHLVPSFHVKDSNGLETTVWDLACRKYGALAKSADVSK